MEIKTCALCLQKKELRKSHIIPKFVSTWVLSTSPTGYMRKAGDPNTRRQDGDKEELLCNDCEQLFGRWEDKFARVIFHPYIKDNSSISFAYDEWLERFIVSVAWRYFITNNDHVKKAPSSIQKLFRETLGEWRDALLNHKKLSTNQHIYFMSIITSIQEDAPMHPRFNSYIQRGFGINYIYNENLGQTCVYIKLPSMLLATFIHTSDPQAWAGTKVFSRGTMKTPQSIIDSTGIFLTLQRDAGYMFDARKRLSESQKRKVDGSIVDVIKNLDKKDMSSWMEAFQADLQLRQVQSKRKLGRNDECYCGSGKKFKRCHYLSE